LLSNAIRGDYSAFYLIRTWDLPSAGRQAGIDHTGIASLFFARYSMFYAARNNFRNLVLNAADPAFAKIMHQFTNRPGDDLTDADVLAAATSRLTSLRTLCSQYHVEFSFLLPPGFGHGDQGLIEAGRRTGTPVFVPVPLNSWKPDLYQDGYHLNTEGAARFTKLLASELLQQVQ
jgi:hypothetical protein